MLLVVQVEFRCRRLAIAIIHKYLCTFELTSMPQRRRSSPEIFEANCRAKTSLVARGIWKRKLKLSTNYVYTRCAAIRASATLPTLPAKEGRRSITEILLATVHPRLEPNRIHIQQESNKIFPNYGYPSDEGAPTVSNFARYPRWVPPLCGNRTNNSP